MNKENPIDRYLEVVDEQINTLSKVLEDMHEIGIDRHTGYHAGHTFGYHAGQLDVYKRVKQELMAYKEG